MHRRGWASRSAERTKSAASGGRGRRAGIPARSAGGGGRRRRGRQGRQGAPAAVSASIKNAASVAAARIPGRGAIRRLLRVRISRPLQWRLRLDAGAPKPGGSRFFLGRQYASSLSAGARSAVPSPWCPRRPQPRLRVSASLAAATGNAELGAAVLVDLARVAGEGAVGL